MRQGSFAHIRPTSRDGGIAPAALVDRCAGMPRGEVRPYAPFGLMHQLVETDSVQPKTASWRADNEQEQRGRTGLAA